MDAFLFMNLIYKLQTYGIYTTICILQLPN